MMLDDPIDRDDGLYSYDVLEAMHEVWLGKENEACTYDEQQKAHRVLCRAHELAADPSYVETAILAAADDAWNELYGEELWITLEGGYEIPEALSQVYEAVMVGIRCIDRGFMHVWQPEIWDQFRNVYGRNVDIWERVYERAVFVNQKTHRSCLWRFAV